MLETYNVQLDAFPQTQAAVIRQVSEHKGENLCIQLICERCDSHSTYKDIHIYFAIPDGGYAEMPPDLDDSSNIITLHFTGFLGMPDTLCYPKYKTRSNLHIPNGISNIILRDCHIERDVCLPHKVSLRIEWESKKPLPINVVACC